MDNERYTYSNNQYPNDYGAQSSGNSYYYSRNNYTNAEEGNGYRSVETNRADRSYIPNEPVRKPKKKSGAGSTVKKLLLGAAVGAFFGISAGVAFYFVNLATGVTDITKQERVVVEEETETVEAQENVAGEEVEVSESGIETTSTQTITTVVTDVTEVVENVMPSVVSITNIYTETTNFWGQSFSSEAQSSGSGIIIGENDSELLIVSNHHVVQDADTLKVQFINDEVFDAQVKGSDSNMDLAVIAVSLEDLDAETKDAISIAKMGDSESLKVGEPAIAIGNSLGYGQSVTTGVISALDRQIEMSDDGKISGELIQTDAAINPGNSGGALLNVKGEVIGINSSKIGGSAIEGMGYAIPISSAEPIIETLMSKETKSKVELEKKGYLGISGINVTSDVANMYGMPEGVYITQVYEGTAAAQAGMLNGDIIVGFEGSTVGGMEDLQGYLEYYEVGEIVEVTIMRTTGGEYVEQTLQVVLGEQVETQERPQSQKKR